MKHMLPVHWFAYSVPPPKRAPKTQNEHCLHVLRRQQELETRLKLSSILGESKTTVVAAADNREELERLAQRLRNAEDDAARLRNALRDQVGTAAPNIILLINVSWNAVMTE